MTDPVPLSGTTLGALDRAVEVPSYDRGAVRPGIVHFGVGGFHRAHEAMYLDRLMNAGAALDWGVRGVGMMPGDARMRDVLRAQDHLYTLVVKHPDGTLEPRVIGSIVDYQFAPDDPEAVLDRMADPVTRIASLTITEGGYHVNQVTGELDTSDPGLAADLRGGAPPVSVFGFITEALARRRAAGVPPFTVMSCDNIPGNGHVAQRMLTAFARLKDPDLASWIETEVRFPNSMVDRITPVTTDDDREALASRFGVADGWPVVCEPFTQWVLEELFVKFLLGYMEYEGTPTLPPVPGVDLAAYRAELIERFANPEVRDTLARLCAESSDRIPKWLLPVVREQLAAGRGIERSALVVASWARYAEGIDEQGEPIVVVDRLRDVLIERARHNHEDPLVFISDPDLFGDLASDERFVASYTSSLRSLHERGARATLEALAG